MKAKSATKNGHPPTAAWPDGGQPRIVQVTVRLIPARKQATIERAVQTVMPVWEVSCLVVALTPQGSAIFCCDNAQRAISQYYSLLYNVLEIVLLSYWGP